MRRTRINNELALLEKEAELIAKQEEVKERRLALAKRQETRDRLEADVSAYRAITPAKAAREAVNQQTLTEEIVCHPGTPLQDSKILTINQQGGGSAADGDHSSSSSSAKGHSSVISSGIPSGGRESDFVTRLRRGAAWLVAQAEGHRRSILEKYGLESFNEMDHALAALERSQKAALEWEERSRRAAMLSGGAPVASRPAQLLAMKEILRATDAICSSKRH